MGESAKLPVHPRAALTPPAARLLAELRAVMKNPADADAVHDARVAARRLLATSEVWLPAGKRREKLRRRLEKLVRRLGRVRNLDVALDFLRKGPASDAAARREIAGRLARDAKAARAKLVVWLTPGRTDRAKQALAKALLEARPDAARPTPRSLGPRLRAVLDLAARGRPMDDPERAHDLRRQIRFLRYQQESLAALYPPASSEALARLFVRLQDAAGEWHDRFVIDREAARFVRRGRRPREAAALRRRLAAEMRVRAKRFEAGLAELVAAESALLGRPA